MDPNNSNSTNPNQPTPSMPSAGNDPVAANSSNLDSSSIGINPPTPPTPSSFAEMGSSPPNPPADLPPVTPATAAPLDNSGIGLVNSMTAEPILPAAVPVPEPAVPVAVPAQPAPMETPPATSVAPAENPFFTSSTGGILSTPTPSSEVPSFASTIASMATAPAPSTDSMPADLSHLMETAPVTTSPNLSVNPPDVQSPATPVGQPTTVVSSKQGFPKIILIIGIVLILIIAGAAIAYFVFGVGKMAEAPASSIPAEEALAPESSQTFLPQTPATSPETNNSLGNLTGATGSAQITPTLAPAIPATSSAGTSALELLKMRQAQP